MARKYTKDILENAVLNCISMAGVLRYLELKLSGGTQSHITRMIKNFGIDTSHFTGQASNKGKTFLALRRTSDDILVFSSKNCREKSYLLKRALLQIGREYKCEECPIIDSYNGKPVTLQIDHIDGNELNNLENNLRFLCPNCHSQTSNYGSKKLNLNKEVKIKNIRAQKEKLKKDRPRKFEVTKEELSKLVWEMPTVKVAELFNVSDKAIERRCKLLEVEKPPRGYWAKQRSR